MLNPSTCDYKACKIVEYLDTTNCSCEKRLIGKIVLTGENDILNTTDFSLDEI